MISNPRIMLAPMAEITTPAFRKTVRDFSTDVVLFSEMLSAGALVSGGPWNEAWVKKYQFDDPFIYQIAGSKAEVMAQACRILTDTGCSGIDINMGCSAPRVLKKGHGAGLLNDFENARSIVSACRKATGTMLSVKMRSGFRENDEAYLVAFVKMLEKEGVDFITLHPRFAKLSFTRSADWSLVKLLKESVAVPVYGNGDIMDAEAALKRIAQTGCNGVMIGRGAVKSPWIFKIFNEIYNGRSGELRVDMREVFMNTLARIAEFLPPHLHKSRGRRFSFYYSKNFRHSHEFFRMIHRVDTIEDMINIVKGFFDRNPDESERIICY